MSYGYKSESKAWGQGVQCCLHWCPSTWCIYGLCNGMQWQSCLEREPYVAIGNWKSVSVLQGYIQIRKKCEERASWNNSTGGNIKVCFFGAPENTNFFTLKCQTANDIKKHISWFRKHNVLDSSPSERSVKASIRLSETLLWDRAAHWMRPYTSSALQSRTENMAA